MHRLAYRIAVPVLAGACALSLGACSASTRQSGDAQAEDTSATQQQSNEETTRRVGKAGIGYVSVPSDWISLATKSGSGDIEFCDITATKIITMKVIDSNDVARSLGSDTTASSSSDATGTSSDAAKADSTTSSDKATDSSTSDGKASDSGSSTSTTTESANSNANASSSSADDAEPVTIDEAVESIRAHAKEYDVTDDNITVEAAQLMNRDATKVTITYGDGTKVISWVLLDDNGNVRYAAAEAPADSVDEVASIIENTYSF